MNKKMLLAGAGLLALASTTMAYGGGYGQGQGGGCHGDPACMAERQAQMKAENPNLNIEEMQKLQNRQGRGQGKGMRKGQGRWQGQAQQNFKLDNGTCAELDDIKNGLKYDLSDAEKEYISHMREEEKIARDVYTKLYEKWGIRTFGNIKDAEQRHMDSVKVLIDKYGLEDSMKSDEVGVFNNPEFQKLYDDLIAKGMKSEIDALQVGMTIEDVDIYDLEKYLAETKNLDVKKVFENLNRGSFNHMKAFKRQLDMRGADYDAQFITEDRMNDILNSEYTHGNHGNHADENQNNNQVRGNQNGRYGQNNNIVKPQEEESFLDSILNFFSFFKFW